MNWWQALIYAAIGVLLGGVITWWCSKHYYEKAAKDFKKEAADLKRLNNYMLLGMEKMSWIKLNRDERGNPIGFAYTMEAESGVYTIEGSSAALVKTSHKEED